jgi:flagella synthesis protein FlgN
LVLNQFNGRYIDQGLQSSQKALSVLKAAAASSMGYGRDGSQGQISFGGRHFGSA